MINFYVPSQYEEMLLAAGWVTMADLDDNYIEYRKRTKNTLGDFLLYYEGWKHTMIYSDMLNKRYQQEVDPFYRADAPVPEHIQELHKQIVDEMSEIETILGY